MPGRRAGPRSQAGLSPCSTWMAYPEEDATRPGRTAHTAKSKEGSPWAVRSRPKTSEITASSNAATVSPTTTATSFNADLCQGACTSPSFTLIRPLWQFLPGRRQSSLWRWQPPPPNNAVMTLEQTSDHQATASSIVDSPGMGQPAVDPAAVEHFAGKLRYETDPSDLVAARAAKEPILVLDVRNQLAWDQGHIPRCGAPAQDPQRLNELPSASEDPRLVVYCWGPACNGSTKAALALSLAGYRHVREMIDGFEYWAREGLAIDSATGRRRRAVDELTAPLPPTLAGAASPSRR